MSHQIYIWRSLVKLERDEEAHGFMVQVLARDPNQLDTLIEASILRMRHPDFLGAEHLLKRLLEVAPEDWSRREEAKELLQTCQEQTPVKLQEGGEASVIIGMIPGDGEAIQSGLMLDDFIHSIEGKRIDSLEDFAAALEGVEDDTTLSVEARRYWRDGRDYYYTAKMDGDELARDDEGYLVYWYESHTLELTAAALRSLVLRPILRARPGKAPKGKEDSSE